MTLIPRLYLFTDIFIQKWCKIYLLRGYLGSLLVDFSKAIYIPIKCKRIKVSIIFQIEVIEKMKILNVKLNFYMNFKVIKLGLHISTLHCYYVILPYILFVIIFQGRKTHNESNTIATKKTIPVYDILQLTI